MAKVWKVIGAIVVIALILGGVCLLVGKITGGDTQRILSLLNQSYDLDSIRQTVEQAIHKAMGAQPLA